MSRHLSQSAPLLEFAVRLHLKPGQTFGGDRAVVRQDADGTLLAVIDGMGYGRDAGRAAEMAVSVLQQSPVTDPHELIARCHSAVRYSRGVTLTVAYADARTSLLSGAGVGGAAAFVAQRRGATAHLASLVSRAGIVGSVLPLLRRKEIMLMPGDLLAMATDGVDASFADDLAMTPPDEPSGRFAERILRRFAKGTDDALILAARWLGRPAA